MSLVYAGIGTLGFALIFQTRFKHLPLAVLGGVISWAVFLMLSKLGCAEFFSVFASSAAVCLYSVLAAKIMKAPALMFSTIGLVPLIPGRAFYYTMEYLVSADNKGFTEYLTTLGIWLLGISLGACFIAVVQKAIYSLKK